MVQPVHFSVRTVCPTHSLVAVTQRAGAAHPALGSAPQRHQDAQSDHQSDDQAVLRHRAGIGHMKMDGRLGRNAMKGVLGDALHVAMCGAGPNLRMILAALRLLCARIGLSMQALIAALVAAPGDCRPVRC